MNSDIHRCKGYRIAQQVGRATRYLSDRYLLGMNVSDLTLIYTK